MRRLLYSSHPRRVFNRLCGSAWSDDAAATSAHLGQLCGPAQQPEEGEWSCGYRLLHAWSLWYVYTAADPSHLPWTPQHFTHLCAAADAMTNEQLVHSIRARYRAANQVQAAQTELLSHTACPLSQL